MRTTFSLEALEDIKFWTKEDPEVLGKILRLIEQIKEMPYEGVGKPERLKGPLTGYLSRRITGEHRLVYAVSGKKQLQTLIILQAKMHF